MTPEELIQIKTKDQRNGYMNCINDLRDLRDGLNSMDRDTKNMTLAVNILLDKYHDKFLKVAEKSVH